MLNFRLAVETYLFPDFQIQQSNNLASKSEVEICVQNSNQSETNGTVKQNATKLASDRILKKAKRRSFSKHHPLKQQQQKQKRKQQKQQPGESERSSSCEATMPIVIDSNSDDDSSDSDCICVEFSNAYNKFRNMKTPPPPSLTSLPTATSSVAAISAVAATTTSPTKSPSKMSNIFEDLSFFGTSMFLKANCNTSTPITKEMSAVGGVDKSQEQSSELLMKRNLQPLQSTLQAKKVQNLPVWDVPILPDSKFKVMKKRSKLATKFEQPTSGDDETIKFERSGTEKNDSSIIIIDDSITIMEEQHNVLPNKGTIRTDVPNSSSSKAIESPSTRAVTLFDDHIESEFIRTEKIDSDKTVDETIITIEDSSITSLGISQLPEYIPLVSENVKNHIKMGAPHPHRGRNPQNQTSFFTKSERKQLSEYNDNTYNPTPGTSNLKPKRMVIIDGSNVAFHHGLNQQFSVKGLKICIDYFESKGHEVKVVVPLFRLNKCTDPAEMEKLRDTGKVVLTPCKNVSGVFTSSYDDRFILQLAAELDAVIVSNDNYRDLIDENKAFEKVIRNRVIGYSWCNDIFLLPKDPYGKWGPSLHSILNRT